MISQKQLLRSGGFTLIEVLVALVVLSLAMVAVIQLTSSHIRTMGELEKRVIASWVARGVWSGRPCTVVLGTASNEEWKREEG